MTRKSFVASSLGVLLVIGVLAWPSPASARGRGGRVIAGRAFVYSPFFYDPLWEPYPYFGYGVYPVGIPSSGEVRVLAEPKQAAVYVDGFYAGVVDDFDGTFQRLHTTPGGHAITLYFQGFRTVTQNVYVAPDHTFKLELSMDRLAPGEVSAPPPLLARPWQGVGPRQAPVAPPRS